METKLTKVNSILDLPLKSTAGNQCSSSNFNATKETSFVGVKSKSSSDDSSVKEQSGGFEKALKKKINVDDNLGSKENESDKSEGPEETKDKNSEVCLLSDSAVNIVSAGSVEQVPVQTSISDTTDLLNDASQTPVQVEQLQNAAASSDNSGGADVQIVTDTQILPQTAEQGASDIVNQQPSIIVDANQGDLSQVKLDNAQSSQNDQLPDPNEILQNKSIDSAEEIDPQAALKATQVEDGSKSVSQVNPQLLNENVKSQESVEVIVSDAPKQTENPNQTEKMDQIKTIGGIEEKTEQTKSLKTDQDNDFQNNTNQNKPNQFVSTQLPADAADTLLASDNNAFEIKSDNPAEVELTNKVDNIQQPVPLETDLTNTHQTESTRDVSQAQNIENLPQSIAKQMQNSVNIALNRNQNQIVVNLSPPELGRVTIKFTENQNQISGVLQVSKSQTRTEIENVLPQVIRNLSESGIQVKRIDVEVYDQNNINQQAPKDQGFQGSFSAQQDSDQGQNNSDNTANTNFESGKVQVADENIDNYKLNSGQGSGSINLFA